MFSFVRVFKFAFQDIGRNIGLSCMTIFVLILMLLSVNLLWSVKIVTNEAVNMVKDQVNINIYLVPDIPEKDLLDLKSFVQTLPEVQSLKIVSKSEVLESFKKRHQMSPEVLDALKELGENPFGPTLVVRTKEPADYPGVISAIDSSNYEPLVETKSFEGYEDALVRIQGITNRIENIGLGLTLIFACIAFLIIFNTVRVTIYTRRTEISIKRLVGAHNWFIRGPYVVESVIFTVISVVFTSVLLYWIFKWIEPYLASVFPNDFSLTNYYNSNIVYLSLAQIVVVLLLTILSSSLAMRKQLKV